MEKEKRKNPSNELAKEKICPGGADVFISVVVGEYKEG